MRQKKSLISIIALLFHVDDIRAETRSFMSIHFRQLDTLWSHVQNLFLFDISQSIGAKIITWNTEYEIALIWKQWKHSTFINGH